MKKNSFLSRHLTFITRGLGFSISLIIFAFGLAELALACGGGCHTYCSSYGSNTCTQDDPSGCKSNGVSTCISYATVCDPDCPAGQTNTPPPAPSYSQTGNGKCDGYCLGACGVTASTCAIMTALKNDAGVTSTAVDKNGNPVSGGNTYIRTTQGGGFQKVYGTLSGGYYVNTLSCDTGGVTNTTGHKCINSMNCVGTVCTLSKGASIAGATGVVYYCPDGLTNGNCSSGMIALPGNYQPGQKLDFSQYIQNACGAIQVDFDTTGAPGLGGAGAVTIDTGKKCTSAAPAASTPTTTTTTSTPPAAPVCLNIEASKANPNVGDTITFTCGKVTGANHYEFQVKLPDGTLQPLATASVSGQLNMSSAFAISQGGAYAAECRICTGAAETTCQGFEPL